jgi:hypothetical protein
MPFQDPDEEDPLELVGVELPATEDNVLEMIVCFAEEYARMGFNGEQILALFQNPAYPPAYQAMRQVGESKVRHIIAEALLIYGRREG